jgi:hypothetical protein
MISTGADAGAACDGLWAEAPKIAAAANIQTMLYPLCVTHIIQ